MSEGVDSVQVVTMDAGVRAAVLAAAANVMFITDRAGTIRWINPAFTRVTGYCEAEAIGQNPRLLQSGHQDQAFYEAMWNCITAGEVWHGELTNRRKDGSLYIDDRTITPLMDALGNVTGFISVGEDVTERRQGEQQLRASEAKFRSYVEHAPMAILILETDGRIVEVNQAALDLFACDVAMLLARRVDALAADNWLDRVRFDFSRVVQGELIQGEYQLQRADGQAFWAAARAVLHGEDKVMAFLQDITARKQEEEMRAALEVQLRQAQKMDALGQLTGGIAHDFNNMLAAILGYSNLALERFAPNEPTGKLGQFMREVVKASERGRELIAKMLAYSRSQPVGLAPRPIAVAPLVKETLRMMGTTLSNGIDIQMHMDEPDLPDVRIEAVDLQQVVMNLAINARDAMAGRGCLQIGLRRFQGHGELCDLCHEPIRGEYVELWVADSGTGIPDEVLPRIFDPFYTTKEVGKGTGLGLSMVSGIIRNAQGHLLVRTRAGRGTTFRMLFPVSDVPRSRESTPDHVPEHEPKTGASVWIVDDEEAVTGYLAELLGGDGYQVRTFSDPILAMDAFRDDPDVPDLVITDQSMPHATGHELVQVLRVVRPDLPVILCTGYSESLSASQIQALGLHHFFSKPVSADQIRQALASALNGA